MRLGWFCSTKNGLDFSHYGRHYAYSISAVWDVSPRLGYSCNTKDQRVFFHTLAFIASMKPVAEWRSLLFNWHGATSDPRAARPVAERRYLRSQPAFPRVPPRPKGAVWSQGALPLARAAVSPQPICMSLYAPARQRRAVRKGTQSPSSTSTKKGWPQC